MQNVTRRSFLRTGIVLPVAATLAPAMAVASGPSQPSHNQGFAAGPGPGERIAVIVPNNTSAPITVKVKVTWYILLSPGYSIVATKEEQVTVQPGQTVTLYFYNDYGATHHGVDINPV